MSSQIIEQLWEQFYTLSPRQRRIVFLIHWHGCTEEEAASRIGIGERTVRRSLALATERLKINIENVAGFYPHKTTMQVRAEEESAHGTETTSDRARPIPSLPYPPSFNPKPDMFLGSPGRESFMAELAKAHSAAFIECMPWHRLHEKHMAAIQKNRQMVADGANWDARYLRGTAKVI